MTDLALYGGPIKRVLIDRAFGLCGQSVTEYELTPEEYTLGLRAMNGIASTFPTALGYNFPPTGDGNPADESGINAADQLGFTSLLAQEISMDIGRAYKANGMQRTAVSQIYSRYQVSPLSQMGRNTIRGAGNRYWTGPMPFFNTGTIADAEELQ